MSDQSLRSSLFSLLPESMDPSDEHFEPEWCDLDLLSRSIEDSFNEEILQLPTLLPPPRHDNHPLSLLPLPPLPCFDSLPPPPPNPPMYTYEPQTHPGISPEEDYDVDPFGEASSLASPSFDDEQFNRPVPVPYYTAPVSPPSLADLKSILVSATPHPLNGGNLHHGKLRLSGPLQPAISTEEWTDKDQTSYEKKTMDLDTRKLVNPRVYNRPSSHRYLEARRGMDGRMLLVLLKDVPNDIVFHVIFLHRGKPFCPGGRYCDSDRVFCRLRRVWFTDVRDFLQNAQESQFNKNSRCEFSFRIVFDSVARMREEDNRRAGFIGGTVLSIEGEIESLLADESQCTPEFDLYTPHNKSMRLTYNKSMTLARIPIIHLLAKQYGPHLEYHREFIECCNVESYKNMPLEFVPLEWPSFRLICSLPEIDLPGPAEVARLEVQVGGKRMSSADAFDKVHLDPTVDLTPGSPYAFLETVESPLEVHPVEGQRCRRCPFFFVHEIDDDRGVVRLKVGVRIWGADKVTGKEIVVRFELLVGKKERQGDERGRKKVFCVGRIQIHL